MHECGRIGVKKEWFFDEGKFDQRHNIVNQEDRFTKFELSHIDPYLDILKVVRTDTVIYNLYVMEDLVQSEFDDLDPFCQATGTGTGTGNRESRIETVPVLTV